MAFAKVTDRYSSEQIERYYATGVWRPSTLFDELDAQVAQRPGGRARGQLEVEELDELADLLVGGEIGQQFLDAGRGASTGRLRTRRRCHDIIVTWKPSSGRFPVGVILESGALGRLLLDRVGVLAEAGGRLRDAGRDSLP